MNVRRTQLRAAAVPIAQVAFLYLLSRAAEYLIAFLAIPVPAGALGLVLLFGLLASGSLQLAWIERGASLLVRHLGLFLIPYAVSFMAFGDLMAASGPALLFVVIASTIIGMAATGWVAQAVMALRQRKVRIVRRMRRIRRFEQ